MLWSCGFKPDNKSINSADQLLYNPCIVNVFNNNLILLFSLVNKSSLGTIIICLYIDYKYLGIEKKAKLLKRHQFINQIKQQNTSALPSTLYNYYNCGIYIYKYKNIADKVITVCIYYLYIKHTILKGRVIECIYDTIMCICFIHHTFIGAEIEIILCRVVIQTRSSLFWL